MGKVCDMFGGLWGFDMTCLELRFGNFYLHSRLYSMEFFQLGTM